MTNDDGSESLVTIGKPDLVRWMSSRLFWKFLPRYFSPQINQIWWYGVWQIYVLRMYICTKPDGSMHM